MHRLAWLIVLAGCTKTEPTIDPKPTGSGSASAIVAIADPCAKATSKEGSLTWIEDDYPAAVACAKQRNVPVLVDLWAPWCHTCLSMKTTVFVDPAFAVDAPKFVFVALDTDKEVNAAAVGKLPPSAWPTYYVIAPDERVLARFVGSASVPQFQAFLDSGLAARAGGGAAADARLLSAERAIQLHDLATADQELAAALAAAPATWPRRADALTSQIAVKQKRDDHAGCVQLATTVLATTPELLGATPATSDFLATAMGCAEQRAELDPAGVKALREAAIARWKVLLADPKAQLAVDDRSDAMAQVREALTALGDKAGARAIAEAQRVLLDEAAAKAGTPMAAMTYNWPRAEVYVYLGKPLELVPALEKSATDLPKEYDPRARLGWIYLQAGKLDEAARWTDAALPMVYGPRKARVLSLRAEIALKQHDATTEKAMRTATVALWAGMPAGQANPDALENAKKALAKLN